jgi:hypothetical protein
MPLRWMMGLVRSQSIGLSGKNRKNFQKKRESDLQFSKYGVLYVCCRKEEPEALRLFSAVQLNPFIGDCAMSKNEISSNFQTLFASNGFRRTFSRKPIEVKVLRDWDGNRLVKTVDGKVVKEMPIPRNWTDRERGESRKWTVAFVRPTTGLHLTPQVEVVFHDKAMGNALARKF